MNVRVDKSKVTALERERKQSTACVKAHKDQRPTHNLTSDLANKRIEEAIVLKALGDSCVNIGTWKKTAVEGQEGALRGMTKGEVEAWGSKRVSRTVLTS